MAQREADFRRPDIRELANLAGHQCSWPGCGKPTSGPGKLQGDKSVVTGKAAHITAAQPGGPRYDEMLLPEVRRSALENGIWMCSDHADLIDKNDGSGYKAAELRQWRDARQAAARQALEEGGRADAPVKARPLPDTHRDEMRAVADEVGKWIGILADVRWPGPPAVVRAFRRHFATLANEVDEYDRRVAMRDVISAELRNAVWAVAEQRGLNADPFFVNPLFIEGVICDRAKSRPTDDTAPSFHEVLGWMHVGPYAVINLSTSTDVEGDQAKVGVLVDSARSMGAYWDLAKSAEEVLELRNPLLLKLGEIRDSHVIWGLGGCAMCGGPSDFQ